MTNQRILIIEDELHIQELLEYNLAKNGFLVHLADNGQEGLSEALTGTYDLILLDLMLPGLDGLEICKRLRAEQKTRRTPVIMLTAKSEELDKVLGLELGADDYITKPFSIMELIARVRAALRRSKDDSALNTGRGLGEDKKLLFYRDITIDAEKYEVRRGNERIVLTLKEFELLKLLVENKGKVLTREFLLDRIWGYDYVGETRTVDVHIRHLRQKIRDEDNGRQMIETMRGVGYRISSTGDE